MFEYLESLDASIVVAVNSWNTPWLDEVMWVVTGRLVWIPLYLFLIYLAAKQGGWQIGLLFFAGVLFSVILSDFVSTQCLKEVVQRYRPSHNLDLQDQLRFYQLDWGEEYRGGKYGFVSSHAANFFAIATFSILYLTKHRKWLLPLMLFVAVLVSYSRLYFGVHYFSDVFVGGIVGAGVAFIVYNYLFLHFFERIHLVEARKRREQLKRKQG